VLLDLIGFAPMPSWTEFSYLVTGTGSDKVTFSGYQNYGTNGLDAVSFTLVPEPGALVMLAVLFAAGVGLWIPARFGTRSHFRPAAPCTSRPCVMINDDGLLSI
jgi:hypothetical protein